MSNIPTKIVAPPWQLKGNGYILVYRFPDYFIDKECFITSLPHQKTWLRLGCVMLVDYHLSEVGAYKELLFIPALFDFGGVKAFHISKIYVSTYDSVYNGIENWGIPKELADFEVAHSSKQQGYFSARVNSKEFFHIKLRSFGFAFPITTHFLPFTFHQKHHHNILQTEPKGNGWGRLCKVEDIKVDSNYFPDITQFKPLLAIEVSDFSMIFPMPKTIAGV